MVLSWIYDNNSDEPIRYPYYAKKWHSYYQQMQLKLRENFYQGELTNINDGVKRYIDNLRGDSLNYFILGNDKVSHAIGIKKRKDGVIDIFDPNYFHVFCQTDESAKQILNYLVGNYISQFSFSWMKNYEYNETLSKQNTNQFPNKMLLMGASARKARCII
jgi:hypothetical protein